MNIKAIASALPEWVVDNPTIQQWSGLELDLLDNKIGVKERRFLKHDQTGVDLVLEAATKLKIEHPDFDPAQIRLLIVITQTPDYKLPHSSAVLQGRLGLSNSTACFDVSLGCSGYVYGLSIAKGLMLSEGLEEALLVTCDPYSKIMRRENRDVIGLFGDAATVTWLHPNGTGKIGSCDFGTDGNSYQHLIIKAGGGAYPHQHLDGFEAAPPTAEENSLHMNGRGIFNFMIKRVPATIDACLKKNKLTRENIDYFVFHQASRFLLETLCGRLGLPPEKVPDALEKTGNTVSSSIPLVLQAMMTAGKCGNARVLTSGFGVGLSWATNIVTFGDPHE